MMRGCTERFSIGKCNGVNVVSGNAGIKIKIGEQLTIVIVMGLGLVEVSGEIGLVSWVRG
jgi:hypothetical protein